MRGHLIELAERVEKASGPDRELDRGIACAVDVDFEDGRGADRSTLPAYTASLDAAMSLANGMGGQVTFFKDGTAKAFLWQPYPMAVESKAATPALALTAACLRARSALNAGAVLKDNEGCGE